MIGGGAVATAAVAAIVATAVITTGGGGKPGSGTNASELPGPADLPSESSVPQPSFSSVAPPPPPDPKDYIADAGKDKAPVTVDSFFPGKKLTMGDRVYAKGATNQTTSCAATTQGALGSVLTGNGCDQVIRATYRKDGVAVTVGLAVFGTEAEAKKTAQQAAGGIASSTVRASPPSAGAAPSAGAPPTPTAATPTSPSAASPAARTSPRRTRPCSRSATT